jgi:outer membrane cobalamin receptor
LIASLGSAALVASPVLAESERRSTEDSSERTSTEEPLQRAGSTRDSKIEEMVVYGVQTGALPSIPGPSTQTVFTDDFVAENKSLAELLSETAGVNVRSFGGAGDRSEVTIRGSTPSQVVITLDGVRANSILTGGLNLSRVCLPLIEKLDITSGAGTLETGGGAIGGVVDIVTRDAAEPGTRARFTAGAFETYEGSLLHSGQTEHFDYTAGYCGFSTEGDFEFARPTIVIDGVESSFEPDHAKRINNDREQHAGTLALGTRLFGGQLLFSDYAAYSSGGEPGVDSSNGETAGQATSARSRDLNNLAQLRWKRSNSEAFVDDVNLMLYHRYESSNFRDPLNRFRGPIDINTRLSTPGIQLSLGHSSTLLSQSNRVDLRIEAAHDMLRADNQSGRDRPRVGVALRESLKAFSERLQFSAGVRLDWTDGFDAEVLPTVGLVLQPYAWIRVRANVGRAYRAPNFDELYHPDEGFIRGNPDLDPEDAWNFDAGGELVFARMGPFSNLRMGASWFRREIDESIVFVRINAETIQPINTGSATTDGFEVTASIDFTRYARLLFNYTDTDSRRDKNGSRFPGQPDREAFGKLRIGPEEFWKLVAEVQYVGEILISEGDTLRLPDRTVWNSSASIDLAQIRRLGLDRFTGEFWVFVEGNNLSDVAVRDVLSFPQPGRRFSAGLELRW